MSITPTLHRTFHIINCSVYFLLPAHAAALFSTRPLSGFLCHNYQWRCESHDRSGISMVWRHYLFLPKRQINFKNYK